MTTLEPEKDSLPSIPAGARIGHVHLKVANLDRAIDFYHRVMGFDLIIRYKDQAAFLSAGGYHHHIGLNTWESKDGTPPGPGTTGLYHFCINYPERRDLAAALVRILEQGWGIDGASNHGTHEAIYMHDPDMNGMELAWDRDPSHWYRNGEPVFERTPWISPACSASWAIRTRRSTCRGWRSTIDPFLVRAMHMAHGAVDLATGRSCEGRVYEPLPLACRRGRDLLISGDRRGLGREPTQP